MKLNKLLLPISVIIVIILVSVPTIYKVVNNHNKNLTKVVTDKIILAAKNCYYDEICTNEKITLKELYDNKYLTPQSNPVTKEYYSENSYVLVKENEFSFKEE